MPDTGPGPQVDAGRNGDGADAFRGDKYACLEEDCSPEAMKVHTLLENRELGGQTPRSRPTQTQPQRPLPTIGTRGQERGEA